MHGNKSRSKWPSDLEFYYKLQLFAKDQSVMTDANLYKIFLCSVGGKGSEFIDLGLGNEPPEKQHLKRLKYVYKLLTRPWTILEMIVEAVQIAAGQPVLFIVDTALTNY